MDTIRKRPVFKQLLEDAARGEFGVVVVHTLDRWSPLVTTLEPYWQGLFHKRVYRNAYKANTLVPIQGTESGGGFLDFGGGP